MVAGNSVSVRITLIQNIKNWLEKFDKLKKIKVGISWVFSAYTEQRTWRYSASFLGNEISNNIE